MDKEIYDFLNDMDMNLDRYKKEELSELEKNKYKKDINKRINKQNKKSNSWKKGIMALAASLILLFSFSKTEVGKSTYALASEVFTNIKYSIKDGLGFIDDIDKYSSKIGLVSESEGIKLKLNDVIVDRDKVYFSFLADISKHVSKEYLEDENIAFILHFSGLRTGEKGHKITMNDKEVIMNFTRTSIGYPHSKTEDRVWVKEIKNKESRDKGIFDIVVEAENPLEHDMDKLGDVDFKLVFNHLTARVYETRVKSEFAKSSPSENIGEFYGEWEFEFTRDAKDLSIETDRYKLDENLILEELDIELIELTSNPLGNKIKAKIRDRGFYEEGFRTSILFDGYDNLGQRRSFSFILEEEEEILMITEHYNQIDYPQYRKDYMGIHSKEANIDFKGVEYIEFTPYYKKKKTGDAELYRDLLMDHKQMGDPFKLHLNK